jgi:predicted histidine transporter YuiF (NhaC family)
MKFTAAALLLSLLATPAVAGGFSGIPCDHPQVIKAMEDGLRNSVEAGSSLISYGVFIEGISKATTLHSSQNKLVCAISLRLSNAGQTTTIRLRYTYEQFGSGKKTASITPL